MHHRHPEFELKRIWEELFNVTKKNHNLDLIPSYILEESAYLDLGCNINFDCLVGFKKVVYN